MPVQFRYENYRAEIRWMYFGQVYFQEPFFEDTCLRCKQLPENQTAVWTSTNALLQLATKSEFLNPDLFIFHVSRCGSTLLSQAFSLRSDCLVLSEVPLLDQLLRFSFKQHTITTYEINAWFKAALQLLGRKRTQQEKFLLVKCDSWHVFFYERLRALFPNSAFSLLTRSPEEVFQSQLKSPGLHAVPGMLEPELFQLTPPQLSALHPHAYLAHVLEFYQQRFAAILSENKNMLLQDYRDGTDTLLTKITEYIQIPRNENWLQEVKKRFEFHSKRPEQKFEKEPQLETSPDVITPATLAYQQLIHAYQNA
jgi:hypothetical protein